MSASRLRKSTTVRLFQLTRLGFRIGETIAPGIASRVSTHLWFRLPASESRRRRSRVPASANRFELDSEGTTVRGWDWGSGPLVYVQHGWGGCVGDFDTIAGCLVANGYRVIAVDGPSHGHSGSGPYGPRASSPLQLANALGAAIDKFGQPHAVVAHSLGCLAAVLELRERATPKRMVMISPFIGGPTFMKMFAGWLGVGPRTFARMVASAEARIGRPMSDFSIPDPALDVDTLIVHDRRDRSTPFQHGEAIADAWPNARLVATEGLGHMRILRSPTVAGEVVAFVTGRSAQQGEPVLGAELA